MLFNYIIEYINCKYILLKSQFFGRFIGIPRQKRLFLLLTMTLSGAIIKKRRRDMNILCDKMIMAVLSGGNATETVRDLTARGFYTTMLSSTGGFLKKKSVTLLIGVERAQVDTVLEILEKHAKKHIEASFVTSPDDTGVAVKTPVKVETGGTVAFVMDVLSCVKF